MDGGRFDIFTRALATRFSRRAVLLIGGFGAAALISQPHLASAATTAAVRFTVIRQYRLKTATSVVAPLLPKLTAAMSQGKGLVGYSVLDAGDGRILTIGVFISKSEADAAAATEMDWVRQTAAGLLSESLPIGSGNVLAHLSGGVDCPCDPNAQNGCGRDTLVCCGDPNTPRGVCVPTLVGCAPPSASINATASALATTESDAEATAVAPAATVEPTMDATAPEATTSPPPPANCGAGTTDCGGTCVDSDERVAALAESSGGVPCSSDADCCVGETCAPFGHCKITCQGSEDCSSSIDICCQTFLSQPVPAPFCNVTCGAGP